jgi:hypothetical protein
MMAKSVYWDFIIPYLIVLSFLKGTLGSVVG